jgi:hypothetical protein
MYTIPVHLGNSLDPVYALIPDTGKGLTWFATDAIRDEGAERVCKVPFSTISEHTRGAKAKLRVRKESRHSFFFIMAFLTSFRSTTDLIAVRPKESVGAEEKIEPKALSKKFTQS